MGKKAEFEAKPAELEQMLVDDPETSRRKFIEDDIEHTKKVLGINRRVTGWFTALSDLTGEHDYQLAAVNDRQAISFAHDAVGQHSL